MISLAPAVLLSLLIAQVGPFSTPGAQPASPLPPEILEREQQKAPQPNQPAPAPAARTAIQPCPQPDNPVDGAAAAEAWLAKASGAERANAGECLGVALSRLERWDVAASAFADARAAADTPQWRARLGAMAGEAALRGGDPQAALAAFDAARPDAGDAVTTGGIAVFRARALVALKREAEAVAPLAEARALLPQDAQVWLLSATLSRRLGKLADAQAQIEKAAELSPVDPAIGLEAGVIAMLAGREDAARKSWQSVVDAEPDGDAAATARSYIAQLSPSGAQTR